ncbi:MAG: cytochrome C oxidase subunit IV family protein [Verrucomicrobia bacterium]|nr:cytochrome C oxidase subunit IV family protein [Verrucomicrobiota bacterium]
MSDSKHAAAAPADAGHHHHHHDYDFAAHKKVYWGVGAALLVGTLITVLAREWEFSSVALTIAVALFIASIKAYLVCAYFMHLLSERKAIYLVMATTVAFAIGMVALILFSEKDPIPGTLPRTVYVP